MNATERLIYAAAYVANFEAAHAFGVTNWARDMAPKEGRDLIEYWEANIAMQAIEAAEGTVMLHRKGLRERRESK